MRLHLIIYNIVSGFILACPLTMSAQTCKSVNGVPKGIVLSDVRVDKQGVDARLRMNIVCDSLSLKTNSQIVLTPRIAVGGDTINWPKVIINGRRQQIMYNRKKHSADEDAIVVKRRNGSNQTIEYDKSMLFESDMYEYDLSVHAADCNCGNLNEGITTPVASRRIPEVMFCRPTDTGIKAYVLEKSAYIDFPVDRIELHPDYRRNPAQLDSIINTINILKNDTNVTVESVVIHGYASPESPFTHNDYLARNRAKTLTEYVRQMVAMPKEVFSVAHTAEDWDGLRRYVAESNLDNKQAILEICNDESLHPDVREKKIRDMYPKQYQFMLATWYPALRHSDYRISYIVKDFDVETAKKIYKTKPQQLSQLEMFAVANTYDVGSEEFLDVMETAAKLFPLSEVANLNVACTRLANRDADGAKPYLDKAGYSPEAYNAWGIYYLLKGDDDSAKSCFERCGSGNTDNNYQ